MIVYFTKKLTRLIFCQCQLITNNKVIISVLSLFTFGGQT
jgi:hypothetical protein